MIVDHINIGIHADGPSLTRSAFSSTCWDFIGFDLDPRLRRDSSRSGSKTTVANRFI